MHFNRFEIAAYLFYFLLSIFISFLINWLFLKFTRNLRAKNNDDLNQERWKTDTKPAVGGFSFYIVFFFIFFQIKLHPGDFPFNSIDMVFNELIKQQVFTSK